MEPIALHHHFLDEHSSSHDRTLPSLPFFSTPSTSSSAGAGPTSRELRRASSPPPWHWMESSSDPNSLPSSPHTAVHSSCSSFSSAADAQLQPHSGHRMHGDHPHSHSVASLPLQSFSDKAPPVPSTSAVSPSKFLFDPSHTSPAAASSPSSSSSKPSPEQQQAMQILAGQSVEGLGDRADGVSGGVGVGLGVGVGVSMGGLSSPHLSPTSGRGDDHRMTLSPLSSQSSASSSPSYVLLQAPPLPRLASAASSNALGQPPPLTPASRRKRKAPPGSADSGRSTQSGHSGALKVEERRAAAAAAAASTAPQAAQPLRPLLHSTQPLHPSPLSVDPHLPMRAPSAPSVLFSEMEYWGHHLSLLQAGQPPLSSSTSSPAAQPYSIDSSSSSSALGSSPSHHPFFHRLPQLHPSHSAQPHQPHLSPSHALPSPAGSYLSSPLASMSPFHSLQIYSPHPSSSASLGSPRVGGFSSGPSSASTALSSTAATTTAVTLAAMPSSSLSFIGPQFNSPLPVASFSLDCSLLEATPSFLSLFHIPSANHLAHLSLFSLLHPSSLLPALAALEALAQAEEERVALPVLACKLSADAIIRTSTTNMNPHAWANWVVPPISTAGGSGGGGGGHGNRGEQSSGLSRGASAGLAGKVVAAVVAGGAGHGGGGGAGGGGGGGPPIFNFDRTGLVLNLAVESCAYALHHALDHIKPTPTAAAAAAPALPSSSSSAASSPSSGAAAPLSPSAVCLEPVHLHRRFPVTSMCFHADAILAPVMDGGGGIHRFLVLVMEKKRRGGAGAGGAEGDDPVRLERMRKAVEDKVKRWRDGVRGKKKKKSSASHAHQPQPPHSSASSSAASQGKAKVEKDKERDRALATVKEVKEEGGGKKAKRAKK